MSPEDLHDLDLAAAAREGDESAFAALYERHFERVLAFTMRYLRCREEAEEVTQEVMLRAHKGMERFEARSKFSTWILGIARHESLFRLRTLRRRAAREDAAALEPQYEPPSLEGALDARRTLLRSLALAGELPEDQRELLLWGTQDGPPLAELARQRNSTLPALKARQMRLRRRIEQQASVWGDPSERLSA